MQNDLVTGFPFGRHAGCHRWMDDTPDFGDDLCDQPGTVSDSRGRHCGGGEVAIATWREESKR